MIAHVTIKTVPTKDAGRIAEILRRYAHIDASHICVFPYYENGMVKYSAYIKIREWDDCDAAYRMIRTIKDDKMARIYAGGGKKYDSWIVSKTDDADLWYSNSDNKWVTTFAKEEVTDYDEYEYERDEAEIMNTDLNEYAARDVTTMCPELDFNTFQKLVEFVY